ncbi:hypothetical protein [Prosthecobacter sp.]|uniref:hypothetical protein n=1 Tax=Prosthecobacter sp. TaxID=1965333 RepID=UPI00378525EE
MHPSPLRTSARPTLALLFLLILAQFLQPGSLNALESPRTPRNPYAPPPSVRAANAPKIHPQGEWYAVGYRMAQEALPSYSVMEIPEDDLSRRLLPVLATLNIKADTDLSSADLKLLQQGWDDALARRSPALTYPPDQPQSIVHEGLRGFHAFR